MKRRVGLFSSIIPIIAAICFFYSSVGAACTVIAVGKNASVDGSVLVSQTDAGEDSRIYVVPAEKHSVGEKAPVFWDIQNAKRPLLDDGKVLGRIPQAQRTFAYFKSAYSHINERQLAIAESTTSQKDELKVSEKNPGQIMTVEQAMIFALQRFERAKEAVRFIGDLFTRYGFLPSSGGESESLVLADKEEAWVFEVFSVGSNWGPKSGKPGAIWAAQRLPDDHATVIPNWSIIKRIDPKDASNFMVSSNYEQEAIDRGWWDPSSGAPFVWQEAYAPLPSEFATGRFWFFYKTFNPHLAKWPKRELDGDSHKVLNQYFQTVEPVSIYPFSAKPEKKISVKKIIELQRSVLENTIYDMSAQPQWLVPDKDKKLVRSPLATPFPGSDLRKLLKLTYRRPVARHRGHYGMICQLRSWLPDEIGGVYWVYLDNPYISPYVPIYAGNTSVAATYNIYDPEKYDERSARWAIDFVDNLANLKFQDAVKDIRAARDPFEKEIMEKQQRVEKSALKMYKSDPGAARNYLTEYSNDLMNQVTQMYLDLRDELITKYTNNRE